MTRENEHGLKTSLKKQDQCDKINASANSLTNKPRLSDGIRLSAMKSLNLLTSLLIKSYQALGGKCLASPPQLFTFLKSRDIIAR